MVARETTKRAENRCSAVSNQLRTDVLRRFLGQTIFLLGILNIQVETAQATDYDPADCGSTARLGPKTITTKKLLVLDRCGSIVLKSTTAHQVIDEFEGKILKVSWRKL